jgi:hypothetical protein
MALADTRRTNVLAAIALLHDHVEGPRLVDKLHFAPATYIRYVPYDYHDRQIAWAAAKHAQKRAP